MKTWPTKKLGEICEVIAGGTPNTSISDYWGGDILWVTPKDLGILQSLEISDTERKITKAGLKNSSAKLLPPGAVILSTRAPIGHLAIAAKPMATNQGCKAFVCGKEIYNHYLYWVLKQNVEKLKALGSGATFAEISKKVIENFEIPLPPLSEQKRIVEKIEKIFAKIEEAERLRAQSLAASAALLSSALHQIFNSKFKNQKSKLQFKIQKFLDVVELIMGQSPPSSSYNKKEDGLPFYQGKKDFGEISPSPSVWCNSPTKIAEANDILISVRAPVGPVNICKEKSAIGRGLAALRAKKDKLDYMYLYYYLKHIEEQWAGRGSTFSSISKKDFETKKIPLPSLSEQKKIVAYLDKLSQKARELQNLQSQTAADFSALRQSVLAKAFSSKL